MSATRFKAGGALTDEHTAIYVERQADRDALAHLRAMDYLLVIEPRQQGKTSLINHLMGHSGLGDTAFAYVDVTTPDRSAEAAWYQALCARILRQLRGFIPPEQWPAVPQGSTGWREFLCDVAAFAADAHRRVIIALDEIGAVTFPGATEFFSVLRDVYNSRQAEPELKQLTFLLAGAFHPRDLIKDDKISPFNVAQRVRLDDFTLAEVRTLVGKGNWPDRQATVLAERIQYWTDGQPYLTQLLCSYLGSDATPADVDAGVERLRREDENHLPPMLERLDSDKKLREYVEQILAGERIKFYPQEHRRQAQLELLGVIKEDAEGYCVVRNPICEQVLAHRLSSSSVPDVLLDFASPHLLDEQDWQYYGSKGEGVHLLLEDDSELGKRVLIKLGQGLDAGARYKRPEVPPLGWKHSHYEFVVRLHPESVICIRVLDEMGEEHTLLYSSAILSGLNRWREFHVPLSKDASDGTWRSLLIDLPKHMEQAQWPGFVQVNWFSLRGEIALAGVRGCYDQDSLLKSADVSSYIVRLLTTSAIPESVQELKLMSFPELSDALTRHTLALFIGADLPREVTGLPSRTDVACKLALRKGLDGPPSLAEVAQRVSQAGNRWEFTAFLRDALDTAGKSPQPFHRRTVTLVKEHQIETIITTAYDNLLELAFQEAGIGLNCVVRGGDVNFVTPGRPTLIKLYGDAQQPDSLVVTDRDHSDLLRDREREPLVDEVRRAFRRNTVLFLGYNLSDPDFRFLFDEIAGSRFARLAYAVWPGLPEADVQMWRDRGIVILDVNPLGALENTPITPAPQPSGHPTASDVRQFVEKDFQQLVDALNDVYVSLTGLGPPTRWSATSNWRWLISRQIDIPADVRTAFDRVVEARERAWGGTTKLTGEQLFLARQEISRILEFLHKQFPAAGVKLASSRTEVAVQTDRSPKLPSSMTKGADMDFERGLDVLKHLAEGTDWYQDFTVHEAGLRENLRDEQRYGPSEQTRRDRTRIVDQLNALALRRLGISFNDLCLGVQPPPKPPAAAKGDGESIPPETYGTGNRWAVLVGVNHYDDTTNYGQLHVCVKDVHAIREQLVTKGFDPARVRLLTDETSEPPTRDNILVALKAVADATEPDDLLLFYYSGHGDEDGGESYLVARNGRMLVLGDTAVRVSRLKEIVEQAPARAKVIILDACHSGADIGGKGPKPMTEAFIRRVFEEAEGLVILASCKQGQVSYEWQAKERSVFTHYLLEAWGGQADRDEKGFVTVQDTNRHVVNGVKLWASQRNLSQTPTLQAAVAGDIILVRYK